MIRALLALVCLSGAKGEYYSEDYTISVDGTCHSGMIDEALCRAYMEHVPLIPDLDLTFVTTSNSRAPRGCLYSEQRIGQVITYNHHPVGSGDVITFPWQCIYYNPTPAPTPIIVSGDPIIQIKGYRVKFDLPFLQASLLWHDQNLELYAKADISTPDKANQWFSEVMFTSGGSQFVSIKPRRLQMSSKVILNSLNTLMLTITDQHGKDTLVTHPDSFSVGDGQINVTVRRVERTVGPLQREVVSVTSTLLDFTIEPEVAKKFSNAVKALKYMHLDMKIPKIREGASAGIFAELFGFIPLTATTARRIRSAKVATE